jgi:hypothetical protein
MADKHMEGAEEGKEEFDYESVAASFPLNPVPTEAEGSGKKYPVVEISNELGFQAGRFGWCIACRNKADRYCKDTRHPVCSFECKNKHLSLVE